jgi:hypothetical protein
MTRAVIPLFATTLFLGSFLMFAVEPMAARQMLPVLGGTPMVWNGCVVFFQLVLLLGYGSAHILSHWVASRYRLLVYAALALLSLPILRIRLDTQSVTGAGDAPLGWLVMTLAGTVGPPFLVLALCSSVVQSSLAASNHKSGRDPYFLYVASNSGSLAALVAYPVLIEPWLGLAQQATAWTLVYAVFVSLVLGCAAWALITMAPGAPEQPVASNAPDARLEPRVRMSDRLRWCALAGVPSSLMLGVTTTLTTDIAPIPLLWVVPLALYLLTFTVAFSRFGPGATAVGSRLLPPLILTLSLILLVHLHLPLGAGLLVHIVPFAIAAMICHGQLAQTRPAPRHLTEFYFWLAFGGMIGGLFNTLIAPALFTRVLEYPIALALAAVLRSTGPQAGPPVTRDVWLPVIAVAVVVSLRFLEWSPSQLPYIMGGLATLVVMAMTQRHRRWAFAGVVGAMLLASPWMSPSTALTLHRDRTFFGTYTVRDDSGQRRILSHGTTMHGMQSLAANRRDEPLTYYHRRGPFGELVTAIPRLQEPGHFAAIGLGVGSLAAYRQPGQQWTFYEIDGAIEAIARDERLFTFLPRCGSACRVVLGDARLSLLSDDAARYQLIALDAFSSDAIPLHLITHEAMRVYLARLAPHGVLAFHISNRHLDLAPIVARLADATNLVALYRSDAATGIAASDDKLASQWIAMARSAADLGALSSSGEWVAPVARSSTPLWTDDFTNLLGVVDFSAR